MSLPKRDAIGRIQRQALSALQPAELSQLFAGDFNFDVTVCRNCIDGKNAVVNVPAEDVPAGVCEHNGRDLSARQIPLITNLLRVDLTRVPQGRAING